MTHDELYHYGVVGMRWRKRKGVQSSDAKLHLKPKTKDNKPKPIKPKPKMSTGKKAAIGAAAAGIALAGIGAMASSKVLRDKYLAGITARAFLNNM